MNKEFIPYKLALELKELGFDEPFNPFDTFYYRNGDLCEANKDAVEYFNSFNDEVVFAPLYQQAFRWFRETHDLFYSIVYKEDEPVNNFEGSIWQKGFYLNVWNEIYSTYEEAELACLNKLIEIIKNK